MSKRLSTSHIWDKLHQINQTSCNIFSDSLKLVVVLISVYAFPHNVCKLVSWLDILKRKKYPMMDYSSIARSLAPRSLNSGACSSDSQSILLAIPHEVLLSVLSRLDAEDLAAASSTCKYLYTFIDTEYLWLQLLKRDFRFQHHGPTTTCSPKRKYRVMVECDGILPTCRCLASPARAKNSCCYSARRRAKQESWWARNRITRKIVARGYRSILGAMYTAARERLYHIPLTPFRFFGIIASPVLLFFTSLRLRVSQTNGILGAMAQDLQNVALQTARHHFFEDAHALLGISAAGCTLLMLHDVNRFVSFVLRSPPLNLFLRIFLVAVVPVAGAKILYRLLSLLF